MQILLHASLGHHAVDRLLLRLHKDLGGLRAGLTSGHADFHVTQKDPPL